MENTALKDTTGLTELATDKKVEDMLQALGNKHLPAELLLEVMTHLAKAHCPIIEVKSVEELTKIRETAMGNSEAAKGLQELFFETALKVCIVRLDCDFNISLNTGLRSLRATSNQQRIRHLDLACTLQTHCREPFTVSMLVRALDVLKDLHHNLPSLKTLQLEFRLLFYCACGPAVARTATLPADFDEKSQYHATEEMLTAFKDCGPLKAKSLKIIYKDMMYGECVAETSKTVEVRGGETIKELMAVALGEGN